MTNLTSLQLAGWKSIKDTKVDFRRQNILIGANGAGKSNLVSFFKLIQEMSAARLQIAVGTIGGSDSLLHFGPNFTKRIEADFRFTSSFGKCGYSFCLIPAVGSKLFFAEEKLTHYQDPPTELEQHFRVRSNQGHHESELTLLYDLNHLDTDFDRCGESIRIFFSRCKVYHFADTTITGSLRGECPVNDNRFLQCNAANLPAMLYLYQKRNPVYYRQIVSAVKAVAPFFDDFILEPLQLNPRNITLNWRSNTSYYEFAAHQLSDGTLRAIALFTLLQQPEEDFPAMIFLDEPELGLHPAALSVLADLIKSASRHCQLVVATQSMTLLDHFEADDIITVNQRDGVTTFDRLDAKALKDWLAEYSLSELWERNVIGGGPY